jgi:hypothetical protein
MGQKADSTGYDNEWKDETNGLFIGVADSYHPAIRCQWQCLPLLRPNAMTVPLARHAGP